MATGELVREEPVVRPIRWRLAALRRVPIVPLSIIMFMLLTAVLADVLTPYSPVDISLPERLRPPFWEAGGSLAHPLGTDPMGRDLLTRMIYGARISLLVGLLGLCLGGGVGAVLGLIAGYAGGRVDAFLMRTTDTALSFPIILLAILLVVILGGSLFTVVLAVALVLWARFARVIRGEALSIRARDFVALARVAGSSPGSAALPASGLGDHRGGVVELSGGWCPTPHPHVGLDDRRGSGLHRQCLVGLIFPGTGHSGDSARLQSLRGLAPRCARSNAAPAVTSALPLGECFNPEIYGRSHAELAARLQVPDRPRAPRGQPTRRCAGPE